MNFDNILKKAEYIPSAIVFDGKIYSSISYKDIPSACQGKEYFRKLQQYFIYDFSKVNAPKNNSVGRKG